jgi:ABC-type transporter Mla subunit MlaD
MEPVRKEVGDDLDDLEDNVKDVTTESTTLANTVIKTVIPALNEEIKKVDETTASYAAQRAELQELIKKYEEYAETVGKDIKTAQSLGY